MQLPYEEELEIGYLSRLFDKTSECYKFFWFKAILKKIREGRDNFTYEELVDEMIADAWYMVSEYHLNLGPKDNLESVVNYIVQANSFKPSEKNSEILKYLKSGADSEVMRMKKILIKNVPYRLLSPFMPDVKGKELESSMVKRIKIINKQERLLYNIGYYNGLDTKIYIMPEWYLYIRKNMEIIKGWLEYKMIVYLQKRNPNVPGIADKLYPPQERNLPEIRNYWKMIMEFQPIHEIYGNNELDSEKISIDHFVPWSYVAHDELWNLHPTTARINSSKSNKLPDWNIYFPLLARLQYLSYQMIWKYDRIHDEFDKCAKEHLNNDDIRYRLYRNGLSKEEFFHQLNDTIHPVYDSAKNSGFANWIYK